MRMVKVDSSSIEELGYDEDKRDMLVKFNRGAIYLYKNVKYSSYLDIINSDSVGKEFHKVIKENDYKYSQIN